MILSQDFHCMATCGEDHTRQTHVKLKRRILTVRPDSLSDVQLPPVAAGAFRKVVGRVAVPGTPYHLVDLEDSETVCQGEPKLAEQIAAEAAQPEVEDDGQSRILKQWYACSKTDDSPEGPVSVTRMNLLVTEGRLTRNIVLPDMQTGCRRTIEKIVPIPGTRLRFVTLEDRASYGRPQEAAQPEVAGVQAPTAEGAVPAGDEAIHEALRKLGAAEQAAVEAREEFQALVRSRLA